MKKLTFWVVLFLMTALSAQAQTKTKMTAQQLLDKYANGERNFPDVDLSLANLTGANLTGANLTGANLVGANLTGAILAGANLGKANLTGANLSWTYLTGADLTAANLDGVDLRRAKYSIDQLKSTTGKPITK